MEVLRRDLRMAGYFGCRNSLAPETPRPEINNNANVPTLTPGFIRNTLNPGPAANVDLLAWDFTFGVPLEGYAAADPVNGGGGWTPGLPVNALIAGALDHSDVVATSYARGIGIDVTAHPGGNPPGSANLQVPAGTDIDQFDILFITDCTSAAVFEVSNANPGQSGSVAHNTGASLGGPGNYTQALGRSFAGAEVYEAVKSAFYIANSPVTGRPSLFRNGDELIEDVERMRVLYGVDTTDDRRVDVYLTAGTAPLDGPPAVDPDWERVIAVQVNLLISSGPEDGLAEQPVAVPFAGGVFNATDNRLYQAFTATIGVRNRLP
jgi:type IV pilus assembly protein PilW